MQKYLLIITFLLTFLFSVSFVTAQWTVEPIVKTIMVDIMGFPSQWIEEPPEILKYIVIPIIGLLAICLGFIKNIRIFNRYPKIEATIGICMALALLLSGVWGKVTYWTFFALGVWAFVLFIGLFILGSLFYTLAAGGALWHGVGAAKTYGEVIKSANKDLEAINSRIQALETKRAGLLQARKPTKATDKELEKLREDRWKILTRIRTVQEEAIKGGF